MLPKDKALSLIEPQKEFYPSIYHLLKTDNYLDLKISNSAFSLKRERRGSILIYSTDKESLKNLFLENPSLYKEKKFTAVDEFIVDFFRTNGFKFSYEECSLFIPKKKSINQDLDLLVKSLPENKVLRELTIKDALLINSYWPFANGEESENYIKNQIQSFGGYLYEYNSKAVCWALRHDDGSLGFLHTLEEYRKLGFAENLTKLLVKKVENMGEIPFGYVVKNNIASEKLLLKLGFQNLKKVFWISINDR